MTNDCLKIIFWNCRSIRNKFMELFDFLERENIDICLLSETWLKNNNKLFSPNYSCIRVDRETTGGGVAILIKKSISYTELPSVKTDVIENVGIRIVANNSTNFKLYSIYFPGGSSTQERQRRFKSDLRRLFSDREPYILCGDLNSRHRNWGCRRANCYGNILTEFTTFFPITVLSTDDPTYVPASNRSSPSTLDLILTNVPNFISHPFVVDELSSDHLPIKFDLDFTPTRIGRADFDYSRANWLGFKSFLRREFNCMPMNMDDISTSDIDDKIEAINHNLTRAEELYIPKKANTGNYVKLMKLEQKNFLT